MELLVVKEAIKQKEKKSLEKLFFLFKRLWARSMNSPTQRTSHESTMSYDLVEGMQSREAGQNPRSKAGRQGGRPQPPTLPSHACVGPLPSWGPKGELVKVSLQTDPGHGAHRLV